MSRNKRKRGFIDQNLHLNEAEPITTSQVYAFESNKHLMMYGCAGTGKTFISLYLAFDDILKGHYNGLIIVRSAVPTRDMGFLPGSDKDKSKVYETPYVDICTELFHRADAYEVLKSKNVVEFITTSFIRGVTFKDSVIIVDEVQNMTFHELDSIITRVGENCRIIFCGDFYQSDLKTNGLSDFIEILTRMQCFDLIEFKVDDIVRSDFIKEYLIQKKIVNESRSLQ